MAKDDVLLERAKRFLTRPIFLCQAQNCKDARMPDDVRIMQELVARLEATTR